MYKGIGKYIFILTSKYFYVLLTLYQYKNIWTWMTTIFIRLTFIDLYEKIITNLISVCICMYEPLCEYSSY